MRADAVPLLTIFDRKLRLEVPLFQRQYVWSQEEQWEPLWDDIARKFSEYLESRKDAPIHFLGAMVLDQKQVPITHVEKRQVIDGQQRLTTLQIVLATFRDFCREQGCEDLARECDNLILNKGMMADPEVDKFKAWPTQLDRPQFIDVIEAGSREALEKKHPLIRKKYHRKPEPRPRMVERGALTADAGIWCLGRPAFWAPLRERGLVADEVVEVLSAADELGALGKLGGGEARSRAIRDALAALERRLRALADPPWQATWAVPADDTEITGANTR